MLRIPWQLRPIILGVASGKRVVAITVNGELLVERSEQWAVPIPVGLELAVVELSSQIWDSDQLSSKMARKEENKQGL